MITVQPQGGGVLIGSNLLLSVSATGAPPFAYQWRLNAIGLSGATNSTLLLANLQPSQSGNYSVTVSNQAGGTLSSNACVQALQIPRITSLAPSNGILTLSFTTDTGRTYRIEFKNSLSDPAWSFLTNLAGNAPTSAVTDNVFGQQSRFYRVALQ